MAFLKLQGRTYDMLARDHRVAEIDIPSHHGPEACRQAIRIKLAPGWFFTHGGIKPHRYQEARFFDWESARNAVRKAETAEDV